MLNALTNVRLGARGTVGAAKAEFTMTGGQGVRLVEVKRLDREGTCANVRHPGRNKMLRKTSLVLAILSRVDDGSGDLRQRRRSPQRLSWPVLMGMVFGGTVGPVVCGVTAGGSGYGCWRWTPDGSICWTCADECLAFGESKRTLTNPLLANLDLRGLLPSFPCPPLPIGHSRSVLNKEGRLPIAG
jgi:hypothetical protein